jgi:hypothetical protein
MYDVQYEHMEPPHCPSMLHDDDDDDGKGNHAIEAVMGVHAGGILLKWTGGYADTLEPPENCMGCLETVVQFLNTAIEPMNLRVIRGAGRTDARTPPPYAPKGVHGDSEGDCIPNDRVVGVAESGFWVKWAGHPAATLEPPAVCTGCIDGVVEFLCEAIRPLGVQVVRSTARRKRPPRRRAARGPLHAPPAVGTLLCTNPAHSFDVRSLKCPRTVAAIIARGKHRRHHRAP